MEIIIELLLQLFGEILLQIMLELGIHSISETFSTRKDRNRFLAYLGFLILGTICGFISLLIVPEHLIHDESLRMMNILITPLCAGMFMYSFGNILTKKGKQTVLIDRFGNAFIFALAMTLVRFYMG